MRTIVAVIRGGPHEYDASIQSGAAFLRALNADRYEPRDVVVSKESVWHRGGVAMPPERALRGADAVVNCVHGRYGQDGWLAHLIGKLGHRTLGSTPAPAAMAFDRVRSRALAAEAGLVAPRYRIVMRGADPHAEAFELFRTFPMPAVVKPAGGSHSPQAALALDLPTLERLIGLALDLAPRAIIEEHIAGEPVSVGVLEGAAGQPARVLFSADLPEPMRAVLADAARRMHEQLQLRHLSQSHFILNSRAPWYIKTDAFPEFGENAPFMQGLGRAGLDMPAFAESAVNLAMRA